MSFQVPFYSVPLYYSIYFKLSLYKPSSILNCYIVLLKYSSKAQIQSKMPRYSFPVKFGGSRKNIAIKKKKNITSWDCTSNFERIQPLWTVIECTIPKVEKEHKLAKESKLKRDDIKILEALECDYN